MENKVKNQAGFTLAETLLAVLILLLVSGIVATGVPVAKNVYNKTVLSANAQVMLSTAIASIKDELGTSWDVEVEEENKNVKYYSADTGWKSIMSLNQTITDKKGRTYKPLTVCEYVPIDDGNIQISSGKTESELSPHPLVPDENSDMCVQGVSFTSGDGIVLVEGLKVVLKSDDSVILASMDKLEIRVISADIKKPTSGGGE